MIMFQEIIQSLDKLKMSNEVLYSLTDLRNVLKEFRIKPIEVPDCLLTPYYINDGKRLELYEYELNVTEVEKKDFDMYLLSLTGQEKVEDIPTDIIQRQKKCYIELLKEEQNLVAESIISYIDYLWECVELKNQLMNYFGEFTKDKLYFEFC